MTCGSKSCSFFAQKTIQSVVAALGGYRKWDGRLCDVFLYAVLVKSVAKLILETSLISNSLCESIGVELVARVNRLLWRLWGSIIIFCQILHCWSPVGRPLWWIVAHPLGTRAPYPFRSPSPNHLNR